MIAALLELSLRCESDFPVLEVHQGLGATGPRGHCRDSLAVPGAQGNSTVDSTLEIDIVGYGRTEEPRREGSDSISRTGQDLGCQI